MAHENIIHSNAIGSFQRKIKNISINDVFLKGYVGTCCDSNIDETVTNRVTHYNYIYWKSDNKETIFVDMKCFIYAHIFIGPAK